MVISPVAFMYVFRVVENPGEDQLEKTLLFVSNLWFVCALVRGDPCKAVATLVAVRVMIGDDLSL